MTTNKDRSRAFASDHGVALLLALVVTGLVAALGLALLSLTNTEAAIAGNHAAGLATLYAAEAAVARARADLNALAVWSGVPAGAERSSLFDPSSHPDTPWGQQLDVAALTAALQSQTASACPLGANTPVWRLFASGTLSQLTAADRGGGREAYLLVWVADDPADPDGNPGTDANNVLVIRAQAFGMGGLGRSVQVVLARVAAGPPISGGEPPTEGLAQIVPDPDAEAGVRTLSWREVR